MFFSIVTIIVTFYGGLTLLLFLLQTRLIYLPERSIEAKPSDIGLLYEDVELESSDGLTITGWFVPAAAADGTLLFFHGNAGNISHRLESIAMFHRLGFNVLIIDYRGYGQSEGVPSEQGTYRDAEAAWRYLVEERNIPAEEIIIFGRSLGGGVAAWLAQQHPPKLLILESTFTSVPDVAVRHYPYLPVHLLARVRYNTLQRLPSLTCPILIAHSPADDVIPYRHSQRLFAAANEPKRFFELTGKHNESFLTAATIYEQELAPFIEGHNQTASP